MKTMMNKNIYQQAALYPSVRAKVISVMRRIDIADKVGLVLLDEVIVLVESGIRAEKIAVVPYGDTGRLLGIYIDGVEFGVDCGNFVSDVDYCENQTMTGLVADVSVCILDYLFNEDDALISKGQHVLGFLRKLSAVD